MQDGTKGQAVIYLEKADGTLQRHSCQKTLQAAYALVAKMLEEEDGEKMSDEMEEMAEDMDAIEEAADEEVAEEKALTEGDMIHWIDEDEDGVGVIESLDEDNGQATIRVYVANNDDFVATDDVRTLAMENVHDYMAYTLAQIDEDLDVLEDAQEDIDEPEEEMAEHDVTDEEKEEEEKQDEDEEEQKAIDDVDLRPTKEMADEATQGLQWRSQYGRGGTEVGVARARDISNRKNLSADTVQRMNSYFARHKVDLEAEGAKAGDDGYPSAGLIAWKLWGGDAGEGWAARKAKEIERAAEKIIRMSSKAAPDELSVGDFVRWESGGGEAQGKITRTTSDGRIDVPDSDFTITGTEDDPAALIEVYERVEGGWRPSGVMVGHLFSTLNKIEPLEEAELKSRIMARFKSMKMEEEDGTDGKIGVIEGYASTYGNTDLGGDVVEKGAFKQTLNHKDNTIPLLLDHGYTTSDVVGIAKVEDDDKGLLMKAEMPLDIPEVADAYKRIKFMLDRGGKMGLSIGYDPVKTEPAPDGTRRLKEVALHEVSITPFPMNTEAQIMSAKSRKALLKAKQSLWQTVVNKPQASLPDAPKGNQDMRGALEALDRDLQSLLNQIKK